jgi:taurine dioxygenase
MGLDVIPNKVPVGAELRGLDLGKPLGPIELEGVRKALDDHGMIFVRGQNLSPEQYVAFGRQLGTPRRHVFDQFLLPGQPEILQISNVVEDGKAIGVADAGQYWHTDGAFETSPHIYSVLNAREIPLDEDGNSLGSTMFVSTIHALESLDPSMRIKLAKLRGLHSLIIQYEKKKSSGKGRHVPLTDEQKKRNPDLYHPVIWPHPRTGRDCLYVNEATTFGIEGMPDEQALALIAELCSHISRAEVTYHHRWAVGDVLVWDNYSTQHKVNFDYGPARRRRMYRLTVA